MGCTSQNQLELGVSFCYQHGYHNPNIQKLEQEAKISESEKWN
jgi:hypothetical protein